MVWKMAKIKNVFDTIFSMENMYAAFEDAARGRRYNKDVLDWSFDTWTQLKELRERILAGEYDIDRYYIFYVYEPKKRMIMSISFMHRIVQWAIYRVLNPMLVDGYIGDSYGCIPGRGVNGAVEKLHGWLQYVSLKEGRWYYLKLDISKYFYRISHRILKKLLRRKIKDDRLIRLLERIIDCEHTPFGLPPGKSPGDVPMDQRLYDVGMPIGNLLSQMFANFYLNELDQFCKRVLRIKYDIRYMDDVIILSDNKEQLHEWEQRISEFLETELELTLNNKTCIRPISMGVEFVGHRVFPDHVQIRKSTTLRIKRSLRGVREKYRRGEMAFEKVTETFQSYLGMLSHTNSIEFVESMYLEMVLTHAERSGTDGWPEELLRVPA